MDPLDVHKTLERGQRAFEEKRYWDAHEIWEGLWHHLDRGSNEKIRLQAYIQVAAIGYHLEKGHLQPASRLARLARDKLSRTASHQLALEVAGTEDLLEDFSKVRFFSRP